MDNTPATPSADSITNVLQDLQDIEKISVLGKEWLRVQNQNRSLIVCTNVKRTQNIGRLERGAEILNLDDDGIVFVNPPNVVIMSIGERRRGKTDILGGEEEEILATIREIVLKLLQEGFDKYPEIPFRTQTVLFSFLLYSDDDDSFSENSVQPNQENEGFLPPVPLKIESDLLDLVVSWVLRGAPERVADFGSGGDALTATLASQREATTDMYLVDLPNDTARVGRMTSAYRYPESYSADIHTLQYANLFTEQQPQKNLKQFKDENGNESGQDTAVGEFDAVVSGLVPGTMLEASEEIRNRMDELGLRRRYTGLSTYLAAEGMQHLTEGGRGAFFLTLGQMARFGILERALKTGCIHSVILLGKPGNTSPEWPSQPLAVVLFENKSTSGTSEDVRIVEVTSETLDSRTHRLIQAPLTQVSPEDVADIDGLEYRTISSKDIKQLPTRLILYEPQLAPFLGAEETLPLEQVVKSVRKSRATGANDFFYFEKTELEQLDFPRRFFTPVIKRPPENSSLNLTPQQVNHYALDLREYINSLEHSESSVSEESVLQSLREDGYTQVADYIEHHQELADRQTFQHRDYWFCPFSTHDRSSEVLLFGRYSDGSWYRLRDKEAIIDQRWYVFECEPKIAESLHCLLNSEPYQNLLTYFGHSTEQLYQTIILSDLCNLPIATGPLEEGLSDLSFPPTRRREQRRLDTAVVERCRNRTTSEALKSLVNPDDRFAWAWFLSPAEYEDFKKKYETDETQAEEFIANKLHTDELREMLNHIAESNLNIERWEIIEELAEEFQQENYRLFMYGVTPQFEGFIMDWAKQNGYTVVWLDGRPYVEIETEDRESEAEPIPKSLGELIDEFLPRGFGDFLQDEVKDLRDATAHGEVIADSREQAAICFLSLHTLALQIAEGKLDN